MSLAGWKYRKSHVITSSTDLTNFQIQFTVYRSTGTDSNNSVYLGTKCNSDFSDVRFTDSSGNTLSYWIESYTSGVSAVIWVKLTSISTSTTIYVYYGKSSATSASNGSDTFILFDDFASGTLNTSVWTTKSSPAYTITDGILKFTGNGSNTYIYSNALFNVGYAVRMKSRWDTGYGISYFGFMENTSSNYYYIAFYDRPNYPAAYCYNMSYSASSSAKSVAGSTFYTYEIQWKSNNVKMYRDSTLLLDVTDTNVIPTQDRPLTLREYGDGYSQSHDWITVRKVADVDPTHSVWGSEESFNFIKPGWGYRKSHTITSYLSLDGYQIRLSINRTSGTDTGNTVYIGENCKLDFSDIRFTDESGILLNHWLEGYTSSTASFWIKLDFIAGISKTIYIYYGNDLVSDISNGYNIFPYFDSFASYNSVTDSNFTSNWTITNGAAFPSNGILTVNASTSGSKNYTVASTSKPSIVGNITGMRVKLPGLTDTNSAETVPCIVGVYDGNNGTGYGIWQPSASTNILYSQTVVSGSASSTNQSFQQGYADAYVNLEIERTSTSSVKYTANYTTSYTLSTGTPTDALPIFFMRETAPVYVDAVYTRQFATVFPTHSSWGSSEFIGSTTPVIYIDPSEGNAPLTSMIGVLTHTPVGSTKLYYGDGASIFATYVKSSLGENHNYTSYGNYIPYAECSKLDWAYSKSHVITNSSAVNLTNYQVKFLVYRSTGTDNGNSVYIGNGCRSDYGDVRFTDELGNVFSYWIESYTSSYATFWVKINSIPASTSKTIYIKYGLPQMTSESSGENTFLFFDDFTTYSSYTDAKFIAKWNLTDCTGIYPTIENGVLTLTYCGGSKITSTTSTGQNTGAHMIMACPSWSSTLYWGFLNDTTNDESEFVIDNTTTNIQCSSASGGTGHYTNISSSAYTAGAYHTYEVDRLTTGSKFYIDESLVATETAQIPTGNMPVRYHGAGQVMYIKTVYIKNIADTEPTHSTWGSEVLSPSAFLYKQTHTLTHTSGVSDYQVKFTLYKGSGSSTGENVYLNNKCNSDFSDIRFSINGTTFLPYWIESYTSDTSAIVWVRMPSISTTGTTLYILYGNSNVSSASNGSNTFLFFDDFSSGTLDTTTKWSLSNSQTYSISDGKLVLTGTGGTLVDTTMVYKAVLSQSTYQYNVAMSARFKVSSVANYTVPVLGFGSGVLNAIGTIVGWGSAGTLYGARRISGGTSSVALGSIAANEYHVVETKRFSDKSYYAMDHGSWSTGITTSSVTSYYGVVLTADYNNGNILTTDWVYVRNANSTDPVHSTYTSEEYNFIPYYTAYGSVSVTLPTAFASFSTTVSKNVVKITNMSSGNINEYYWDFGDGTVSNDAFPCDHVYTSIGTYTIKLYVSNQLKYSDASQLVQITALDYIHAPESNFKPSRVDLVTNDFPYSVSFTNLSYPLTDCTYYWTFGTFATSTEVNPTISFPTHGSYTVSLTATSKWGSNTKTYIDCIYIHNKIKYLYDEIITYQYVGEIYAKGFTDIITSIAHHMIPKVLIDKITGEQDQTVSNTGLEEDTSRTISTTFDEWGHIIINKISDIGARVIKAITFDRKSFQVLKVKELEDEITVDDTELTHD